MGAYITIWGGQGMRRKLRRTFRGRGFYLLAGTLCATVVIVMAACCTISLLTIGRATQQESRALDSAITAFDLYQQERSPVNNSASDAASQLDADGALTRLAANPEDTALREQIARRLGAFEHAHVGDVQSTYVVLENAAGGDGFALGSSSAVEDARSREERLTQIDLADLTSSGKATTRLSSGDGPAWSVSVLPYADGVSIVVFYHMPEVPNVDVLEPIADIVETYFVDAAGTRIALGADAYRDAIDVDVAMNSPSDRGIVDVTHNGQTYREYFHKPTENGQAFVLIVPDVAQAAYHQFALVIVVATIVLIALGCAAGLYLTNRIYEPLQDIIAKLAPGGRDVQDEFKLIGFALDAMENRLSEQDELVGEFHLMRLLRGRATLAEEGAGFFFAEPNREVSLAIVRTDEQEKGQSGTPREVSRLRDLVRGYLEASWRAYALCEESGFVLAVIDAQGGGIAPLLAGLLTHAQENGTLISVFASNVHAGATKLSLCYREAISALEEGTRKRAFNKVVRCDVPSGGGSAASGDDPALPGLKSSANATKAVAASSDLLAYVQANYRDPALTAALVAERFGMSRTAVSRAFAQACPNGGFLGYLHGLRLDKAEELLRTSQLSIPDIATSVGYGTVLTMTRAFKRYRDTTPGAYRKGSEQ